ncbi:MAG: 16S rRNA (cytidine(1402)-2'-O)-methyltransferase [Patescibacteria group bacterium]
MLYIIATPIGNLEDMTLRAIRILKQVEYILCEDTRVTKKLLDRYKIQGKKLIGYHQHTKQNKTDSLIKLIQGNDIALVTDAGTPGISDPGNRLISQLKDVTVIPIPGASALTSALSVSGLPTDEFVFLGFIPHKKGKQTMLKQVWEEKRTVVFYESKHRIIKTLKQLKEFKTKDKKFIICRELTKKFETIYRGNIEDVLEKVSQDNIKGEYVVVVG